MGKEDIACLWAISPFFYSIFKRLVLQTCKNQGLFGKELRNGSFQPRDCPGWYRLMVLTDAWTLSLMFWTTQEALVDSVDQDQTAQNMQSDIWCTLSTVFIVDYNWTISSICNGNVFLGNEKIKFIYLVVKEWSPLFTEHHLIIWLVLWQERVRLFTRYSLT